MEKQKLRISVNCMIKGEVGAHFNGSNAFMSMPMCEALTKFGIRLFDALVGYLDVGERCWLPLPPVLGHEIFTG